MSLESQKAGFFSFYWPFSQRNDEQLIKTGSKSSLRRRTCAKAENGLHIMQELGCLIIFDKRSMQYLS